MTLYNQLDILLTKGKGYCVSFLLSSKPLVYHCVN